jgi:16S rRNA processing protein RimM
MSMNNYFSIGKLVATFGVNGELVLRHQLGKKTALKGLEVLFVEDKKDAFLPYFLLSSRIKSDTEVYLQLEGITSKEAAQKLVQKEIWLEEADFQAHTAHHSPLSLLGFDLYNEEENLGPILEVIEQPHQVLCRILYNGKDALIPLHEETLDKIDRRLRSVHLSLPDGLLDIYS